jgi:hypothetical protein
LAKHGTTQPYTDFAVREIAAQAGVHTNPIRESSSIAGLHRTDANNYFSGAQIHRMTYFWNPVPSKTFGLFIRSNNGYVEFQGPELRGFINEEAQKSWAKTPDLNVKRSKRRELIESRFWP